MNSPFETDISLSQFTGTAPLFPLPGGVLLPYLVQPLHIFEDRYRAMTAAALEGDRFLALGLLRPGWEKDYESKTVAVYPTVCLGSITVEERLEDGRYNIIVQGLTRARITHELETPESYRIAALEPVEDVYPPCSPACWESYRRELISAFQERFPQLVHHVDLQRAVREDLSLGVLADLLASSLRLDVPTSAALLAETDVRRRCRWVLKQLGHTPAIAPDHDFPPEFSVN